MKKNNEQVVIWMNTIVGKDRIQDFENWLKEEGFHVTYLTEFVSKDSQAEGNHILFSIADEDISRFAIWRFRYGGEMKWWEDFLDNFGTAGVPFEILEAYPYSWEKSEYAEKYTE